MGYEERRVRARIAEKKYRDNLSSEKKAAHNATRRKRYEEKKAAYNAKRREGYVKQADLSEAEREIKRKYQRQATRKYRANLDPEKRAGFHAKAREKQHTPEWRAYKNQWEKNRWANNEDYRQKILAQNKAMRRWLRSRYGVKYSDYTGMLASQGGLCAICKRPDSGRKDSQHLHVDHCHKTGKIRGLLCAACNNGLGQFKDDPHLLRAAAKYLGFHQIG